MYGHDDGLVLSGGQLAPQELQQTESRGGVQSRRRLLGDDNMGRSLPFRGFTLKEMWQYNETGTPLLCPYCKLCPHNTLYLEVLF